MIYFDYSEFDSPDKPGSSKNMKPHVLYMLDIARGSSGIPFKINSGFRTPKHNKDVGGSITSSHLGGWAVDISCSDPSARERILYGLIKAGFQRIGIANTFIHADIDPHKQPAIWLY